MNLDITCLQVMQMLVTYIMFSSIISPLREGG